MGICCLSLTHSPGVTERNTVGRHLDKVRNNIMPPLVFIAKRRKEQNRIKLIVVPFITEAKPKLSKNYSQASPGYPLPHGCHGPSLLLSLLYLSLGTPSNLAMWTLLWCCPVYHRMTNSISGLCLLQRCQKPPTPCYDK